MNILHNRGNQSVLIEFKLISFDGHRTNTPRSDK
jgi:hypothetical protein